MEPGRRVWFLACPFPFLFHWSFKVSEDRLPRKCFIVSRPQGRGFVHKSQGCCESQHFSPSLHSVSTVVTVESAQFQGKSPQKTETVHWFCTFPLAHLAGVWVNTSTRVTSQAHTTPVSGPAAAPQGLRAMITGPLSVCHLLVPLQTSRWDTPKLLK